jgi:RecJ-like exonuclease
MSSKCRVEKVEDIGQVCESDEVMSSGSQFEVMIGEITGCSVVDKYRSCLFCSGKVEGQRCGKCGARVKPDHCPLEICAKIHVVEADLEKSARNITLHVFTKQITKKSIQDLQNVSGDEICDMIVEGCGVVTVKYRNGVLKDVIMH